jgi:hypothetical protein
MNIDSGNISRPAKKRQYIPPASKKQYLQREKPMFKKEREKLGAALRNCNLFSSVSPLVAHVLSNRS